MTLSVCKKDKNTDENFTASLKFDFLQVQRNFFQNTAAKLKIEVRV